MKFIWPHAYTTFAEYDLEPTWFNYQKSYLSKSKQ